MYTFIVATNADPNRPGMMFKVELPDFAVEDWWVETPLFQEERLWFHADPKRNTNTVITMMTPNGLVKAEAMQLTWMQVTDILRRADYDYPDDAEQGIRRQGRPEKRVLLLTTSKDRRVGAVTARGTY